VEIGLVSDTHGRLRKAVFERLRGVDRILHAGDIGPVELLTELEVIAPVTAVYGNTDGMDVRERVHEVAELDSGGFRIVVMHGHQLGSPSPAGLRAALPAADVIVYGHTHRPLVDESWGAALVVNPGAAGAARFGIPPSVGILTVTDQVSVELITLDQ
jgi:putative phosphoesterase